MQRFSADRPRHRPGRAGRRDAIDGGTLAGLDRQAPQSGRGEGSGEEERGRLGGFAHESIHGCGRSDLSREQIRERRRGASGLGLVRGEPGSGQRAFALRSKPQANPARIATARATVSACPSVVGLPPATADVIVTMPADAAIMRLSPTVRAQRPRSAVRTLAWTPPGFMWPTEPRAGSLPCLEEAK